MLIKIKLYFEVYALVLLCRLYILMTEVKTHGHSGRDYKLSYVAEGLQRAKDVHDLYSWIGELSRTRSPEDLASVPQVVYSIYGCAFFAAYFRRCTDFRGSSFLYPHCK